MGIFFAAAPAQPTVLQGVIRSALEVDPGAVDLSTETMSRTNETVAQLRGASTFKAGRFLAALAILAAFVIAGIITDTKHLDTSTKALYGLAATTLGIIVGLLGGEKAANG